MDSIEGLIGIGIACAVVGLVIGLLLGRSSMGNKKAAVLQQELDDAKSALQDYKTEVFQEFGDTAAKFEKLNESYADLHQQLAKSASVLCADMPSVPLIANDASPVTLQAQPDADSAANHDAADAVNEATTAVQEPDPTAESAEPVEPAEPMQPVDLTSQAADTGPAAASQSDNPEQSKQA